MDISDVLSESFLALITSVEQLLRQRWKLRNEDLDIWMALLHFFSEMAATAILVGFGCMSIVGIAGPRSFAEIGLGWGFIVVCAIVMFGHITGPHMNPAVTIGALILGRIALDHSMVYFLGQFIGAFVGFGMLKVMTPKEVFSPVPGIKPGLCSPAMVTPTLTKGQGILVEFFATFCLVGSILAHLDFRQSKWFDSFALKIGAIVGGLVIATGPYTGCHMNPARTLAPAVIHNEWLDHVVYWVGEFIGAIFAGLVYAIFFDKTEEDVEELD